MSINSIVEARQQQLRNLLRQRLGDAAKTKQVFSDEALDAFLELADSRIVRSDGPTDHLVGWAYIYALMAQIPREAGKEMKISDNGVVVEPSKLSEKLITLVQLEMQGRPV